MAKFSDRDFDLRYAAWKAARLLPRGKRLEGGAEAFAPFARAFEAQLDLAGYRIEKRTAAKGGSPAPPESLAP